MIDRVVNHYIVPKTSRNFYLDTSETPQTHMSDIHATGILLAELNLHRNNTLSKIDQDAKLNINIASQ